MDSYNKQLADLELRLHESAIEQGYSFEDDPFGEALPFGADPEEYNKIPETHRWLTWADWEQDGDQVVVKVGSEEYRFEWAAFEDLYRRYGIVN